MFIDVCGRPDQNKRMAAERQAREAEMVNRLQVRNKKLLKFQISTNVTTVNWFLNFCAVSNFGDCYIQATRCLNACCLPLVIC